MKLTYDQYSKLTPQLKEEYRFLRQQNHSSVLSKAAIANTFILIYISVGLAMESLGVSSYDMFAHATIIAFFFLAFASGLDIILRIVDFFKLHKFKKRAKTIFPQAFRK